MTTDTVGGVWTFALALCREWAGRGVEVMLLSMGRMPDEAQQDEARSLPNLSLVPTAYGLEWMQGAEDDVLASGRLLQQLAQRFQPDIVHANGYYHASLPFEAPVVLTAHSCVSSWWRACKKYSLPAEWRRYEKWVADGVIGADMVTAPTGAFLREFEQLHGQPKASRAIWNGCDLLPASQSHKSNIVLAAGRLWDEAKNTLLLNRVARDLEIPVMVAGDTQSPDGVQVELANVTLLGRLGREYLRSRMTEAAIFASPARYEPFGLSVLEAALAGCALVLGDIPTMRELWDDAAVFVHPDNDEGWRTALSALQDKGQSARYGSLARQRATTYSASRMAAEYWQVYGSLLQSAESHMVEAAA